MRILLRTTACAGGLFLALLVMGHVFMIGYYAPDWRSIAAYGLPHGSLAPVVGAISIYFNSLAMVWFVILIVLTETYALRSWVFYVACGLTLTVFIQYEFYSRFWADQPLDLFSRPGAVLLAMGVTIGLVYWAVAGRKAGKWRQMHS